MSLIETKKLNKSYITGQQIVPALRDINLQIDAGEYTAIAGPSGSGKTTLLNCLGCIDKADSGELILDGVAINAHSANDLALLRREHFGFIFQTYNLIPVLNVFENIELPLKLLKRYSDDQITVMIEDILQEVGLAGLDKRMPLQLSGGQQQRVSIARALVKKPKIVFADEPTANLDSKTGEAIINLMRKLNEKDGITFLFSTHDPLIMNHAKRLIEIRDGRLGVS